MFVSVGRNQYPGAGREVLAISKWLRDPSLIEVLQCLQIHKVDFAEQELLIELEIIDIIEVKT